MEKINLTFCIGYVIIYIVNTDYLYYTDARGKNLIPKKHEITSHSHAIRGFCTSHVTFQTSH